uniref:flagellin N-terminal helical domain-containing protein n=1 Tax=Agathobacter sp. TaxID=2021311 RepID=UPI0040579063
MKINRNMSAVMTNNQLLRTENKITASMERLSSGFKINHASDNPAGISISTKMKAQIDALDQAESNASDAINVLQIADGALNEISSMLQRMRELSVQASNGTYSYNDRQSIQAEIDELQKEVDRISTDTEYNTKTLLDGSSDVRVYADSAERFYVSDTVMADKYQINVQEMATQATIELDYPTTQVSGRITINGVSIEVNTAMSNDAYMETIRVAAEEAGCYIEEATDANGNATGIRILTEQYGSAQEIELVISEELAVASGVSNTPGAELKDGEYTMNLSGTDAVVSLPTDTEVSRFTTTATVHTTGNRIQITDSNGFNIDFSLYDTYVPQAEDAVNGNYEIDVTEIGSMTIQIGANEFQTMDVRICEISSKTLYVDTIDVSKVGGAERAMVTLDEAIAKLSATRSRIGAFQNRLEYATAGLAETSENITGAYSTLIDTDMAEEMTEYTQQTIISQASVSVLSQANDLPQQVLSLLQ